MPGGALNDGQDAASPPGVRGCEAHHAVAGSLARHRGRAAWYGSRRPTQRSTGDPGTEVGHKWTDRMLANFNANRRPRKASHRIRSAGVSVRAACEQQARSVAAATVASVGVTREQHHAGGHKRGPCAGIPRPAHRADRRLNPRPAHRARGWPRPRGIGGITTPSGHGLLSLRTGRGAGGEGPPAAAQPCSQCLLSLCAGRGVGGEGPIRVRGRPPLTFRRPFLSFSPGCAACAARCGGFRGCARPAACIG